MRMSLFVIGLVILTVIVAGCTEQNELNENEKSGTDTVQSDRTLVDGSVPKNNVSVTNGSSDSSNISEISNSSVNTTVDLGASSVISLSGLKVHNSRNDCWVSFQGKVYDITEFLPKHPGSAEAIIPYCGTSSEFEKAFTGQHGMSQVKVLMEKSEFMGNLAN
jgi:cytochrome b involved in lipid metabolism